MRGSLLRRLQLLEPPLGVCVEYKNRLRKIYTFELPVYSVLAAVGRGGVRTQTSFVFTSYNNIIVRAADARRQGRTTRSATATVHGARGHSHCTHKRARGPRVRAHAIRAIGFSSVVSIRVRTW